MQSTANSASAATAPPPGSRPPFRLIVRLTEFVAFPEAETNPDYYRRKPYLPRISAAIITASGNLAIHTKAPYTQIRDIQKSAALIPAFSPPEYTLPFVELDLPWHGVVLHGVPVASLLERETGVPGDDVRNYYFYQEGEEENRESLALRIMLEDPTVCKRLCRDGAFLLGTTAESQATEQKGGQAATGSEDSYR